MSTSICDRLVTEAANCKPYKDLEEQVNCQFQQLKGLLEDRKLMFGKRTSNSASSIQLPTNISHFTKERLNHLRKLLEVSQLRNCEIKSETCVNDITSCYEHEFAIENLPSVIQEFLLERVDHIVFVKHALLLRWSRFIEDSETIDKLLPHFHEFLTGIMKEYQDVCNRLERLTVDLSDPEASLMSLKTDDLIYFLQCFVSDSYSRQLFNQFFTLIKWLPVTHQQDLLASSEVMETEDDLMDQIPLRLRHDSFNIAQGEASSARPLVIQLQETLSTSSFTTVNSQTSDSVGKLNDLEICVPRIRKDSIFLKAKLTDLATYFGLNLDLSLVNSSAEEMMVFGQIAREFPLIFVKQQQMMDFPVYGGPISHTGKGKTFLKPTVAWRRHVKLFAQPELEEVQMMNSIAGKRKKDDMLVANAHFIHLHDEDRVMEVLHAMAESNCLDEEAMKERMETIWEDIYAINRRTGVSADKDDPANFCLLKSLQMLGLDDGDEMTDEDSNLNGLLHSFILLRHLHIRSLQRKCLSILNFFLSIERMITIYDCGLSQQLKKPDCSKEDVATHFRSSNAGSYLYSNPKEFRVSMNEFMEFAEVENHDDFYDEEDEMVIVKDSLGRQIMYDQSLCELRKVERQVLDICSHFIQQDKRAGASHPSDYFTVMEDCWSLQLKFLRAKLKLIDLYAEVFQHSTSSSDRHSLSQVMINVMYRLPRVDLGTVYFSESFRTEIAILRVHTNLVNSVIDKVVARERVYSHRNANFEGASYVSSHHIVEKCPISLARFSSFRTVFLTEMHPCLSQLAELASAVHAAVAQCRGFGAITCQSELLGLELNIWRTASRCWSSVKPIGSLFSPKIQREVLNSSGGVEEVLHVNELARKLVNVKLPAGRLTQLERQRVQLQDLARLMEILKLRFLLKNCVFETEVLSKVYQEQAAALGFDCCHLFLRFIQFEYATAADVPSTRAPPFFITAVQEEDGSVDRYNPSTLFLAIHELDEGQIGRLGMQLSDSSWADWQQTGLQQNLQIALAWQVLQRNLLAGCVWQVVGARSLGRQISPFTEKSRSQKSKNDDIPQSFVSIQLEKAPSRDEMLNKFIKRRKEMGEALDNPKEMMKLKRQLLSDYCLIFNERVSQINLRAQLLAAAAAICRLLEEFPAVREKLFKFGAFDGAEEHEKSGDGLDEEDEGKTADAAMCLSEDGNCLLNLYHIPHPLHALLLYKRLRPAQALAALRSHVAVMLNVHDILVLLCCHARQAGRFAGKLGPQWGGDQGIVSVLEDIQREVLLLNKSRHPAAVAEFLSLKRSVLFLQFEVAICDSLPETFLQSNNVAGFESVRVNAHAALECIDRDRARRTRFSTNPETSFNQIEHSIMLSLAALSHVDKQTAHGEIVNVTLSCEDFLKSIDTLKQDSNKFAFDLPTSHSLPISKMKKVREFLLLCRCFHHMKMSWGAEKLSVSVIDTSENYHHFIHEYQEQIQFPIYQNLAQLYGYAKLYSLELSFESLTLPAAIPECEAKYRQLLRLCELKMCDLLNQTHRFLQGKFHLVESEMSRDEDTLPVDLWRRPQIQESVTVNRLYLVEKFAESLQKVGAEEDGSFKVQKKLLEKCLSSLDNDLLHHEREMFETYCIYYENIIKTQNILLKKRETEIVSLKFNLDSLKSRLEVEVHCRMAEVSAGLLQQLAEAKSALAQSQDDHRVVEEKLRHLLQTQYHQLVCDLVGASVSVQQDFDELQEGRRQELLKVVSQVKNEASIAMTKLQSNLDETDGNVIVSQSSDRLVELESRVIAASQELKVEQVKKNWEIEKCHATQSQTMKTFASEIDSLKLKYAKREKEMEAEHGILRKRLEQAENTMKLSEEARLALQKKYDHLLKEQREKAHAEQQKKLSKARLEKIKQKTVIELTSEIERYQTEIDGLRQLCESAKSTRQETEQKQKDTLSMRRQMMQERALKAKAYAEINHLRQKLHEITDDVAPVAPAGRTVSAFPRSRKSTHYFLQRPKTTAGRLRVELAQKILADKS